MYKINKGKSINKIPIDNIEKFYTAILNVSKEKSKDNVKILKNMFIKIFRCDSVLFYKIDDKQVMSNWIDDCENHIPITKSLLQIALKNKEIIIEDYPVSNKYFNANIDNPLSLKIRGLLIVPIFEKEKAIGVIFLYRLVKNNMIFDIENRKSIEVLIPLLSSIYTGKMINDDKYKQIKEKLKDKDAKRNAITLDEVADEEKNNQLESLQEKYDNLMKKYKQNKNILKYANIEYMELKSKLETVLLDFNEKIEELKSKIRDLSDRNEFLKNQNINTETKIKKNKIDDKEIDFESLLQHANYFISNNTYAYVLFEIMLYAINSNKHVTYIDENLKKTALVQQIIYSEYFKNNVSISTEKYNMGKMVKCIKRYEKSVFSNAVGLDINIDKEVPPYLVLDVVKVESIILHLLVYLQKNMEEKESISIIFLYKDKNLTIEIFGKIKRKSSFLINIFQISKLNKDIKEHIGIAFSKKLIEILNGKIDCEYKEKYHKFILSIPASVSKM